MLALLSLWPSGARAVGYDYTNLPKVPLYLETQSKDFENQTKKITVEEPYQDKFLSYQINLPKGWISDEGKKDVRGVLAGDQKLSNSVLAILARYISPAKNLQRSNILVEAQSLPHEISIVSWFVNFTLLNGLTLTALTLDSEKSLTAIYVEVEKDQTYLIFARAIINGSNLLLVRYFLPQENFDEEKVQQAQIVSSFKLLNISDAPIEEQKEYGFLDQSYFNYPSSWALKEKSIFTLERMSATLLQEHQDEKRRTVLEGRIKIEVVSKLLKTNLPDEIKKFRNDLKFKDYSLGGLIENISYKYDPSMRSGKAQIYKLEPDDKINMQSYEFVVAAMEGSDYYYICSLITPSREQDYYAWARNMESARVVFESVRRHDMPKVDVNDPYYDYLKESQ